MKEHGKEIILSIVAIIMLIVGVIAVSYAMYTFSQTGAKENVLTSGTISFAYNENTNGISLTNAQPMSDERGKTLVASDETLGVEQGYFDFTVTGAIRGATTVSYEVYGVVDSTSDMDPAFIKVYLTDGGTTEQPLVGFVDSVPTYDSLNTATSDPNGKRLYTGSFTQEDDLSQSFRLRIWISDAYTIANVSKTFRMTVNVKAIAS